MSISKSIKDSIEKSSWIRKMFEEGARLKEQFGSDNVYDFSLGNPDLEPPEEFFQAIKGCNENRKAGVHGYMPNSGFPEVRGTIARKVSKEHNIDIDGNSLVMTCGAAGGSECYYKNNS